MWDSKSSGKISKDYESKIMAKKKTKEEILLELIENIKTTFANSAKTADSIAKDYAVTVANLLNCKEEETIEKRTKAYIDFKIWETRAIMYKKAEQTVQDMFLDAQRT